MLATVAATDSASTVKIYSEAEPHAMYATYKETRTLCVLQYISISSRNGHFQSYKQKQTLVDKREGGLRVR